MIPRRWIAIAAAVLLIGFADGANLAEEVFHALERAIKFFKDDSQDVNLDGLYGLRVAEGQVTDILEKSMTSLPLSSSTKLRLDTLLFDMEITSKRIIRNIKNTDYYREFRGIVNMPFRFKTKQRYIIPQETKFLDPLALVNKLVVYDEEFGDECFEQMMGTSKIHNNPRCSFSNECIRFMTSPGATGYLLTHQILYLIQVFKFNCTSQIQSVLYPQDLSIILDSLCGRNYAEAQVVAASTDKYRSVMLRDFLLEEILVCNVIGYDEFLRRDWLLKILSWQDRNGCFKEQSHSPVRKRRSTMRKLLTEQEMKDGCLSHTSGLGIGVFGLYLKYLLENNGELPF